MKLGLPIAAALALACAAGCAARPAAPPAASAASTTVLTAAELESFAGRAPTVSKPQSSRAAALDDGKDAPCGVDRRSGAFSGYKYK